MQTRRVALVHGRTEREHAREYQMLVDLLNGQAVTTLRSDGWDVSLHAAGEGSAAEAVRHARSADLVIVLGGEDVHPSFYGGATEYPGSGTHDLRSDEAQLAVIHDAVDRGAPLLGICRGHQLLNVALGGNLLQHLPTDGVHRKQQSIAAESADVRPLDPFTPHVVTLHEPLVGAADGSHSLLVQSSHHQAVDHLGTGLRVAADHGGLVEAIAHEDAPVFGVQWHPEHPAAPQQDFARLARFVHASVEQGTGTDAAFTPALRAHAA